MSSLSMVKRRSTVIAKAGAAVVLLSILMLGVAASATDSMGPEAKALAKLDDDWSAAAATRDAKRVASFYAEDAIAYPPNEPMAIGKAAAERVWAAYFADSTYRISWKTTHADVTGALGYTTGTYEDSYKGPDGKAVNSKGKYVCVWRKQSDGTWKAVHDMWNSDSR
jgi:ketosteroid isomerase-like protein